MPHRQRPRRRPTGRGRRIRHALLWTLAAAVLLTAAAGSLLYHRLDHGLPSVDLSAALAEENRPDTEPGQARTLLVAGTEHGSVADGERLRAYSAMVIRVPGDGTPPTAVNLPSRLRVERPDCAPPAGQDAPDAAGPVPLAALHSDGGPACVVGAVEQLSGIRMDHYIEVDLAELDGLLTALVPQDGRGSEEGGNAPHDGLEPQQRMLLDLLAEVQRQDVLASPARLYRIADAAARALTTDTDLASLSGLLALVEDLGPDGAAPPATMALPEAGQEAEAVWRELREG